MSVLYTPTIHIAKVQWENLVHRNQNKLRWAQLLCYFCCLPESSDMHVLQILLIVTQSCRMNQYPVDRVNFPFNSYVEILCGNLSILSRSSVQLRLMVAMPYPGQRLPALTEYFSSHLINTTQIQHRYKYKYIYPAKHCTVSTD